MTRVPPASRSGSPSPSDVGGADCRRAKPNLEVIYSLPNLSQPTALEPGARPSTQGRARSGILPPLARKGFVETNKRGELRKWPSGARYSTLHSGYACAALTLSYVALYYSNGGNTRCGRDAGNAPVSRLRATSTAAGDRQVDGPAAAVDIVRSSPGSLLRSAAREL